MSDFEAPRYTDRALLGRGRSGAAAKAVFCPAHFPHKPLMHIWAGFAPVSPNGIGKDFRQDHAAIAPTHWANAQSTDQVMAVTLAHR
jgi:hypothetical protein